MLGRGRGGGVADGAEYLGGVAVGIWHHLPGKKKTCDSGKKT